MIKLTSWGALVLLVGCGAPKVAPVNDCAEEDFVDLTAPSADRRVGFGTALESPALGYAPRCVTIARGQVLTFVGSFSTHPLSPGAVGEQVPSGSPIPNQQTGQAPLEVTFPTPGVHPFRCTLHTPLMAGVIRVQ